MSPRLACWYFILNTIFCVAYFSHHLQQSGEFYWSVVAMLNNKVAVLLCLSELVSIYTAFVVSVHFIVFDTTKEGERFVRCCQQANSQQS